MPGGIWISAIAWVCGAICNLTPSASVDLREPEIRMGDVVDLACVANDNREAIANMIIAELPTGASQAELSRAALKSLARRRVPGMTFAAASDDAQLVTLRLTGKNTVAAAPVCARARSNIAANTIILADMVETSTCEAAAPGGGQAYYDRLHGLPRAAVDLPAGANLGRLNAPQAAFDAGDRLSLSIAVGAVRIEREVEAMQPAVAGETLFVRDANGAVFPSPTTDKPQERLQ